MIYFSATCYRVSVKTGDVRGAGTDATAYIKMYGSEGDTGKITLKQSENTKNKFERGRVDQFVVEAMDIGEVCFSFIYNSGSKTRCPNQCFVFLLVGNGTLLMYSLISLFVKP